MRSAISQKPSNASGQMYDTLYLMRECIKSTGVTGDNVKADRIKLRDCWSNMNGFEAPLMGATSIDKNGDGTRIPTVLEVKGHQLRCSQVRAVPAWPRS